MDEGAESKKEALGVGDISLAFKSHPVKVCLA